ncbi:MAG: response regulator [Desulfuromonadaceae bacterium]
MEPSGQHPEQRVLVVDDEPTNLRILSEILRPICRISAATGGRDALELARSQPFRLILLDVNMPDMNGFDVCRKLKSDGRTRDIPVIFISAVTTPEGRAEGLALGGIDFIGKPINPAEVQSRVKALLEQP